VPRQSADYPLSKLSGSSLAYIRPPIGCQSEPLPEASASDPSSSSELLLLLPPFSMAALASRASSSEST